VRLLDVDGTIELDTVSVAPGDQQDHAYGCEMSRLASSVSRIVEPLKNAPRNPAS
jgi:hypothetical protein